MCNHFISSTATKKVHTIPDNNVKITYKNGTIETISKLIFNGVLAAHREDIQEYVFLSNPNGIYKLS